MKKYYNELCEELKNLLDKLGIIEKNTKRYNQINKIIEEKKIFEIMNSILEVYHKLYKILAKNNNKVKVGPRNTNSYKQSIYVREVELIKQELFRILENFSFEELCDYVALKRKMIEFLKLTFVRKGGVSFHFFGKKESKIVMVLNHHL